MHLFGKTSVFASKVAAATDGEKEDWAKIMLVVDLLKENPSESKECLSQILARLLHEDPHIALQAITLLGSCVSNCGKPFHLQVASKEFESEIRKFITKNTEPKPRKELFAMLKNWAENEFSKDSELALIPSLCNRLQSEGYSIGVSSQKKIEKPASVTRENTEDSDLTKAIELSLKEAQESSPKNKSSSSGSLYPSTTSLSSSLYPSVSSTESRKVRALYDFEAAEDGELTFKAGELITIIEDADQNWWKGSNQRGEGLFPSNFVTSNLTIEPEQPKTESKRSVQFNDEIRVKKIVKEEVEIDEGKMDQLLHVLHEADPTDPSRDPPEMRDLIDEVNAMGPLIDSELELVDRKATQLNALCMDLQGSLNLYHQLIRDSQNIPGPYMSNPAGYPYQAPQPSNGGQAVMGIPGGYQVPSSLPPAHVLQHPFIPAPSVHHANMMPQYGPQPPGPQPMSGMYAAPPMQSLPPQPPAHSQQQPPLL